MPALERITTEYIDTEDRLRLSGETPERTVVVVWLALRLMQRLIPVLTQWLEQKETAPGYAEAYHSFAQSVARGTLEAQAPVCAAEQATTWLAHSIDVTFAEATVTLTFKDSGEQRAILNLETRPLRQWLGILHEAYLRAEWPLMAWPEWVNEQSAPNCKPETLLH